MAISTETWHFGAEDCQIAQLTADPAGGTATYGSWVNVPGIKSVTVSGDVNTVELRGDNSLLDSRSTLTNISVAIEYAMLSQDVLEVLLGGTSQGSGSGTTEVNTFSLAGDDSMNYFKLQARTPDNGGTLVGGDIHYVFYKLILSGFPEQGLAEEDYRTFTMEARAIPRLSDKAWYDYIINETADDITGS